MQHVVRFIFIPSKLLFIGTVNMDLLRKIFIKKEKYYLAKGMIILLFTVDILYIISELVLSGTLFHISTGATISNTPLVKLEAVARTLSGIGLGLFIFSVLRTPKRGIKQFIMLILCITVSIPAMHFTQKGLVSKIVELKSSPSEINKAQLAINYRDFLFTNGLDTAVKNNGSVFHSMEDQTALTLIPIILMEHQGSTTISPDDEWNQRVLLDKREYLAASRYKSFSQLSTKLKTAYEAQLIYTKYKPMHLSTAYSFLEFEKRMDHAAKNAERDLTAAQVGYLKKLYLELQNINFGPIGSDNNFCNSLSGTSKRKCQNITQSRFETALKERFPNEKSLWKMPYSTVICGNGWHCKNTYTIYQQVYPFIEQLWLERSEFPLNIHLKGTPPLALKSHMPVDSLNVKRIKNSAMFFNNAKRDIETLESETTLFDNISAFPASRHQLIQMFINAVDAKGNKFNDLELYSELNGKNVHQQSDFFALPAIQNLYKLILRESYFTVEKFDYDYNEYIEAIRKTPSNQRKGIFDQIYQFTNQTNSIAYGQSIIKSVYIPVIGMGFSMFFAMIQIVRLPARFTQLVLIGFEAKKRDNASKRVSLVLTPLIILLPFILGGSKSTTEHFESWYNPLFDEKPLVHEKFAYNWFTSAQPFISNFSAAAEIGYNTLGHPHYVGRNYKNYQMQVRKTQ